MRKSLKIMVLYPEEMNIYGDYGNLLTLKRRAQWHGFKVETVLYEPGMLLPTNADIVLGGGGQDSGQEEIQDNLLKIGESLRKLAEDGVPMLMICGMYQLFGHHFLTAAGKKIKGIGIFDAYTVAGAKRLIGNTVMRSAELGELIGYENHSGLTYLGDDQKSLARIIKGAGNNGRDNTEGARAYNVFGSYAHGPLLPKNPRLADELIRLAAIRKYGSFEPANINDSYTEMARKLAKKRPR